MASYVYGLGEKIYSQFPQNIHTKKVAKIQSQIDNLLKALEDRTSATFQNTVSNTLNHLKTHKETKLKVLQRLNGAFYQDPDSNLKKAWDNVVEKIHLALNEDRITSRDQLDLSSKKLSSLPDQKAEKVVHAHTATQKYILLEKKRDSLEAKVKDILSIEKTGPQAKPLQESFLKQKENLERRQKELCGDYFEDQKSLLDQTWKKYQQGLKSSSPDAFSYLDAFNHLEKERKTNEGKLFALEQYISVTATSERSIETLTVHSMEEHVKTLERAKKGASDRAGIDWKLTAFKVATNLVSLLAPRSKRLT